MDKRLRRSGSEGSEGSEGGGGGFAASFIKRRAAGAAGCVEGLWKKVLKMDRPLAGGFLSLTALRAEGCGLPLCGNAYKVSVTGFTFGIIWQNKHYDDQPTPVAFPPLVPYGTTFPPLSGGTIKIRKAILS